MRRALGWGAGGAAVFEGSGGERSPHWPYTRPELAQGTPLTIRGRASGASGSPRHAQIPGSPFSAQRESYDVSSYERLTSKRRASFRITGPPMQNVGAQPDL